MTTLLLDTDIIAYRAATSAETEVDWGDDIWSLYTDLSAAKEAFATQVDKIVQKLGGKEVLCCLSDHKGNFRRSVDASYKSNRKGTRKPVGYVALCDWIGTTYAVRRKPNLEADDVLGILSTWPGNAGKCVVVSDDKDLKTIPGKLYRPTADEQLTITPEEADRNFLTQCLTGDVTDGFKGVPGIGPKKAEAILGTRPHWGAVENAYLAAGLTKQDAITQARLARILRYEDWDETKGEPILWKPQQSKN